MSEKKYTDEDIKLIIKISAKARREASLMKTLLWSVIKAHNVKDIDAAVLKQAQACACEVKYRYDKEKRKVVFEATKKTADDFELSVLGTKK